MLLRTPAFKVPGVACDEQDAIPVGLADRVARDRDVEHWCLVERDDAPVPAPIPWAPAVLFAVIVLLETVAVVFAKPNDEIAIAVPIVLATVLPVTL